MSLIKKTLIELIQKKCGFSEISLTTRVFLALRLMTASFEEAMAYIPSHVKLLDIGCGHGLLAYLVSTTRHAQITGIDPDKEKIMVAKKINSLHPRCSFESTFLQNYSPQKKFDAITIFDVDYLLPPKEKQAMLILARNFLTPNGKLYLKTTPKSHSLAFLLTYLQELLTVHILNFTFSSDARLHFMSVVEYQNLCTNCRYKVEGIHPLEGTLFHPHHLFILKK